MTPTFGTSEWFADQAPKGKTVLMVPRVARKDGRFLVEYRFTSRTIRKVITADKLAEEKASGKFDVFTI